MPIWFLVILALNTSDINQSVIRITNAADSKYNNQSDCMAAGQVTVDEMKRTAPSNAVLVFTCQSVDYEEIKKAIPLV